VRSSIRSASVTVGVRSSARCTIPPVDARRTPKPALPKTCSIGRFSLITSASKRVIPRAAATSANCCNMLVASPRPCWSSATAKATSAASGSLSRS
jgi:hypothetical protein